MGKDMKNRFGINMINLLRIHGINQSRLANDLDINKGRISQYINGKTEPSSNDLQKIAQYFNKSPESLLNDDFSKLTGETKDPKDLFRKCFYLFPIFSPEKNEDNIHFNRAFMEQKKLYLMLSKLDLNLDAIDTDAIIDEYEKVIEEGGSLEKKAIANTLSFSFITIFFMRCMSIASMGYDSLPIMARKELDDEKKMYTYSSSQESLEGSDQEFRNLINDPEYFENITEYYSKLKEEPKWSDLVDYYICLQYFFGAVKNAFSYEQNHDIGQDLLITFACCGNPYANEYINTMFIS